MDQNLKNAYTKLINKHYSAVQTDGRLQEMDGNDDKIFAVEKKSKLFWEQFKEAEKEFLALLETK
jgi:hypothetical protein